MLTQADARRGQRLALIQDNDLDPAVLLTPGRGLIGRHRKFLAVATCRHAGRLVTKLGGGEPLNPVAIRYLNRLSDHLFVLAHYVNDKGSADVLWVPGANREA